jgi:hypothetical protein
MENTSSTIVAKQCYQYGRKEMQNWDHSPQEGGGCTYLAALTIQQVVDEESRKFVKEGIS